MVFAEFSRSAAAREHDGHFFVEAVSANQIVRHARAMRLHWMLAAEVIAGNIRVVEVGDAAF
eukprot:SAG11_NODE_366_length_10128_cov_4.162030_10_plen_62_part_00